MIIKKNSNNFIEIKKDLENYIKNSKNYKDILKIDNNTLDLITSLLSGYISYNNYKYSMFKEETFLRTAKKENSVYEIAYNLGYKFQRAKSPEIVVKYTGFETKFLKTGDILGSYGKKYELVYFGDNKKIENSEIFNVSIGIKKEINEYNNFSDYENILEIAPDELSSIDNDKIKIYNNNTNETLMISDVFQDYFNNDAIINWSASPKNCLIYFNDYNSKFGILDLVNVDIVYLESDGEIKNFNDGLVKLDKEFDFIKIDFFGKDYDSIEKIKSNLPKIMNTKNLAIRKNDIVALLKSTNFFDDVLVEKDKGVPAIWKLEVTDDTQSIHLNIEGAEIYVENVNKNKNDFIERIYQKVKTNELVKPIKFEIPGNEELDLELYFEQTYLDREISISKIEDRDDYKIVLENSFQERKGCNVSVFYVKSGEKPIREFLTKTELLYIDEFMKKRSIIGIEYDYISGTPKFVSVSLTIELVDNIFQEEVYNYITKKIKDYEYKLNSNLEINNLISELLKFKTSRNNIEIYPIRNIFNNISEDLINSKYYEYIVFENIDIIFR